ncbi:MAG TPA: prolyl oligopeptidase family serine peptidase [Gemmataceae bacterium]|nr:prolyl oligopeptidase family serine peptidase [Gemmataceae bacterium]
MNRTIAYGCQREVLALNALKMLFLVGVGLLLLSANKVSADDKPAHGFLDVIYKDADGKEAKYVVFVPKGYTGDKAYPLILFLHGSGETGTDGKKQAEVGLGKAIRAQEDSFPFIAVFPQSQKRNWQATSEDGKRALAILDEVEKNYKVDKKKVYLTGLSMGGYGTWSFAAAFPDRWAAIVPICGFGDSKSVEKIKNIPCWCFHGEADKAVNVEMSRKIIKALKDAGAKEVEYTEYPGVGHNSWDKAYATKELYDWLLKHELK